MKGDRCSSGLRARRVAATLAAACLLAFAACAGGAKPEVSPAPSEPAWQSDAAGRRFVVRPLEKRLARRVDESHARTTWGVTLDLAGEDDGHWYYRVYETVPAAPPSPAARSSDGGAGDRAGAKDDDAPALRESDALRFEPAGEGLPQRGQWRDGFDLADLNGDGRLDLVHGPARKGAPAPQLFLGDGRGGFAPWREARVPALPYDYGDAGAGDLDGDGAVDLVLASHMRGLVALLGDGRGGFARAGAGLELAETGAASFSSRAIRVADVDGDGRLDVLALGEGPRLGAPGASGGAAPGARAVLAGAQGLVLYRGRGDGGFERREPAPGAPPVFGRSLALGDFDGDGRLDAATASSQLGRRDVVQLARAGGALEAVAVEAIRWPAYVLAVAAADFDRDGRADLALGYAALVDDAWRSGVDVLFPQPDGSWRRLALAAAADRVGPQALAAGDLDGDGAADLVALGGHGALAVFRGDGRGAFSRERRPPPPFPGGCRGAHVAIGDLDGDGRGDVVASFAQERVTGEPDACPSEGGLAAWRSVAVR